MKTRRQILQSVAAAALPALPAQGGAVIPRSAATRDHGLPHAFNPTLFELRRYDCEPGQRDTLIDAFERWFLDAYQAGGTRVVATCRDLDDPDRWLWIRAFRSAPDRGPALQAFYGSAAWKTRADPANATIRDILPALLLRPVAAPWVETLAAAPAAGGRMPDSRLLVEIHPIADDGERAFRERFERDAAPLLASMGAAPFATLVTDRSPNSFPRQPVRDGTAFVTLTRFADAAALAAFEKARAVSVAWRDRVAPALAELRSAPLEAHRLQPTARSALR